MRCKLIFYPPIYLPKYLLNGHMQPTCKSNSDIVCIMELNPKKSINPKDLIINKD